MTRMSNPSRTSARRALGLCLACLAMVAGAGSEAAHGQGNVLNPAGTDATRRLDGEGLSQFYDTASRSPAGLLYPPPYLPPRERRLDDNWRYSAGAELAYLADDGDEPAMYFNDYRDLGQGGVLNFLGLSLHNPERGYHADFRAGAVARGDQYYRLDAGQYGRFSVAGFLEDTPHAFSAEAVTIFEGAGTPELNLPPSLQPGNNSLEEIRRALRFASAPDLSIDRRKSGLALEYRPAPLLILEAAYERQQREGARPWGGSFLPPFNTGGKAGGMVETIEPIDYATDEVSAALNYAGTSLQFNGSYEGSFFRNSYKALTYENPYRNLPGSDFLTERGRLALYPDNDFHRLQLDLAQRLPLRGRLFVTTAWSRMRQDDILLPPTVNSGLSFTGIELDSWNSRAALPRDTAEAEIDQLLLQSGLQLVPLDRLTIKGGVRYRDEDNRTDYTAFNPLSGEFGYISEDGAEGGAVFEPGVPQEAIRFRAIPFADRMLRWNAEAALRLGSGVRAGLEFSHQRQRHAWRERGEIRERRWRLYYSNRALEAATLRLSYEQAERDGDAYRFNPYGDFLTSSLPGFRPVTPAGPTPHTLAELRKFDLGDRRRRRAALQANFLLAEDMDLLLAAQWHADEYDAAYGLRGEDGLGASVEWNYQPSPALTAYAWYNYQEGDSGMANINDSGFSSDPHAGGESYPFNSAWRQYADERFHAAGVGLNYRFGRFEIETAVSYNNSRDSIEFAAASTSALANPETGGAAGRFPALRFRRLTLESGLRWTSAGGGYSLKLYHRYEEADVDDWHFRDLRPLTGRQLFLNAVPGDFAVHLVGLFWQYRLGQE